MKARVEVRNRPNKKGEYPIVLRLYSDGISKMITIKGVEALPTEWDSNKRRFTSKAKGLKLLINQLQHRANDILYNATIKGETLKLNEFEARFKGQKLNAKSNSLDYFYKVMKEREDQDKLSSAKALKETIKRLQDFHKGSLPFEDITPQFLSSWEKYLKVNGNSDSGVAFKMRELRSMINKAIDNDIIDRDHYPFSKYKISKLKSKPSKSGNSGQTDPLIPF